jgi:hypothetical protein
MLASIARQLRNSGRLQALSESNFARLLSAQAATAENPFYNVPEGHVTSDLSNQACNLGLARRRDLTLRQAVRLTTLNGEAKTLAEVFKVGY